MTCGELIENVNDLMTNTFSTEQKVSWLKNLDGKIFLEVMANHEHRRGEFYDRDDRYTEDTELLVQPPYAEDIYTNYLMAQIAAMNAETIKYNQYITLYNNAYDQFASWYNKTHMPVSHGRWRF